MRNKNLKVFNGYTLKGMMMVSNRHNNQNNEKLVNYIKTYYPYIFFFLLMVFLHIFMKFSGDNDWFSKILENQTLLNFLSQRYYGWGSRLIIESILLCFPQKYIFIWGVLDSFLNTIFVYYIIKLVNVDINKNIVVYGLLLFLMYPILDMSSAGWIPTTLNYSWCFAFGIISFIPLIKKYYDEKSNILIYIFAIFGLVYATNQEQSCALIFGFNLLYLIKSIVKKEKVSKYNILALVISILSLIMILSCPGNSIRFVSEISTWYPEFASYGLLQKIYLGTIPTIGQLLENKLIFPLFYVLLNLSLVINIKNKNLKYLLYFNIIFILLITIFKPILINLFPNIEKPLILLVSQGVPQKQIKTTLMAILISVYLLLSSCLMLYKKYDGNLLPLILFIAGFMSRFIMGFSPTIFASGSRTMIFFYMVLIILTLMIITKLYREKLINERSEFMLKITLVILAIFNYINVFLSLY